MCFTLIVIFHKKVKAREIEMGNLLEGIWRVVFMRGVGENAMDPGGEPAEAGVIRTVWNKVVGGGELAVRKMSCSTAEKGESSQGVAG